MSTCAFCCENSTSIYTCSNCNNKVCYQCLLNSIIHNDNKCLCPFCDYECSDIFVLDDELLVYSSNKSEELIDDCILCYDTCYHPIKCEICHHSYCKECFKRLIDTNESHPICAYCRQSFSKTFIDKSLQEKDSVNIHKIFEEYCHEFPFEMDNKVIKCKYCNERFEYDVLKAYFMTRMKCNPDYKPECIHCHQEWNDKFMFDNFESEFCKNDLKLHDPDACIYCQERKMFIHCQICEDCLKHHFQVNGNSIFDCKKCHTVFTPEFMYDKFGVSYCKDVLKIKDPKGCNQCNDRYHHIYTCNYCHEKICKEYMLGYLKEKYEKKEEFDCVNCHHTYNNEDLDKIFGKETCKKEFHIKYSEDCVMCNSEKKHSIDYENEKITCQYCNKKICIYCIQKYLSDEAIKNYKVHYNNPNIRYVSDPYDSHIKYFIDDTLHCPYCNHIWSNQYIYEIYKKYVYEFIDELEDLHIAAPSMICYKCGMMPRWPIIECKCCDKVLCKSCYKQIIFEKYGTLDNTTHKYNFKQYIYGISSYMIETYLNCELCLKAVRRIKLFYSHLYHDGHYEENQYKLEDYTLSDI